MCVYVYKYISDIVGLEDAYNFRKVKIFVPEHVLVAHESWQPFFLE